MFQSGCELWQKGFTALSKIWKEREQKGPSCRKRHFCRGVDTECSSAAGRGILQCCRDAACHQQGIAAIPSSLDSFGQRDCCSVQLLSRSELLDCVSGASGLLRGWWFAGSAVGMPGDAPSCWVLQCRDGLRAVGAVPGNLLQEVLADACHGAAIQPVRWSITKMLLIFQLRVPVT